MSKKQIDRIKKQLRQAEINTINNFKILEDTEILDKAIRESLASDKNILEPLLTKEIPHFDSQQFFKDNNDNIETISIDDFLSFKEINEIESYLNRPLVKRAKWDKWDYTTVFIISLLGVIIDNLVGNPKKGVSAICSDKNSFIGSWFEDIHSLHPVNNPIDYQGYKMGGGGHRLRSIGHDLLGFPFGLWQIMNGTFTGGYYQDGKYFDIISKVNQFGKAYETKSFIESLFSYVGHVFCDFFSTYSLPVPGFGYLAKMPSREIRVFAANMYNSGFNLRHMFVQGFSVLFIEIMIRTYSYFRYKKVQKLTNDQYLHKRRELLLLSHSLVAGFNIGKVTITGDILSLNLPQILAVVYHFIPFVTFYSRNNNKTQKIIRNLNDLNDTQQQLENKLVENMKNDPMFHQILDTDLITLRL